jgi:hypothetical protein
MVLKIRKMRPIIIIDGENEKNSTNFPGFVV